MIEKIISEIQESIKDGLASIFSIETEVSNIMLTPTRKEFKGDVTLVVFPFTKQAKKAPEAIANSLGEFLQSNNLHVESFNVVKGFLNIAFEDKVWQDYLKGAINDSTPGKQANNGKKILVEYSSPNTNKPLHLGHIRNILLGWSCAKILKHAGNKVVKTQIINDRGIHICKSMIAWMLTGNGETPGTANLKGDHFVGKYYVAYNNIEKEQKAKLAESGDAKSEPEVLTQARELLKKWEANDPDTRKLWEQMNGWVYDGFDETYKNLGVTFDEVNYESQTYLLGKKYVEEGLSDDIFYKKDDGSVWIDLEDAKMDQKLVLRSDGTSVYMTQDIGTAQTRYENLAVDKMVYVVGDEQNYHFKVLFEIMKRLKVPYAEGLFHLSYGMVDLPTGRMKSREGTVVDADDLIAEVIQAIRKNAQERGTLSEVSEKDQSEIFRKLGLGALKYFILKVNPKKRMVFNPEESVDIQGNTGPYIQNAYVRIQSVLRKAGDDLDTSAMDQYHEWEDLERELVVLTSKFSDVVKQAAADLDPSAIANYVYEVAKTYHKFYHDHSILGAEDNAKAFRLALSKLVANILRTAMDLLGIEMPEKM